MSFFDKKLFTVLTILTYRWRHFGKGFENEQITHAKDFHLSLFQKLRYSDTCSQLKSCSKHDRSLMYFAGHSSVLGIKIGV